MPILSESNLKSLVRPEKGSRIYFDEHRASPKGFGVKIAASGSLSFVLRYFAKDTGRDRLVTIGKAPTWTLASARAKAIEYKRQTDGGADILENRRHERVQPLLSGVTDRYCQKMTDRLISGSAIRSVLERYLVEGIGKNTKFADIRRSDVRDVVDKLAKKHPRQAALLLTYTKGLFSWAEDEEIITASPVATLKPAKIDKAMNPKNFQRGRVLDDEEIKTFWLMVESAGLHRLTALCLKLILITGQRPGEVAGIHINEINGDLWTIPDTRRGKTQTALTVPLTKTAKSIMSDAQEEIGRLSKRRGIKPVGYIFETRPGNSPAVNAIDRAVKRFTDALGNRDVERWGHWTPHDLRRTCRTGLAAAGVSETVAELTIGHTRKGIASTYDLHTYDAEKRRALEAWERRLLRIINDQKPDDNVVMLDRSQSHG